jgi:hypothetical protein
MSTAGNDQGSVENARNDVIRVVEIVKYADVFREDKAGTSNPDNLTDAINTEYAEELLADYEAECPGADPNNKVNYLLGLGIPRDIALDVVDPLGMLSEADRYQKFDKDTKVF